MSKRKKKGRFYFLLLVVLLSVISWLLYRHYILNKATLKEKGYAYLYIGKNDGFEDLLEELRSEELVEDTEAFAWLAERREEPASSFRKIATVILFLSFIPDYVLPVPHRSLWASSVAAFLRLSQ